MLCLCANVTAFGFNYTVIRSAKLGAGGRGGPPGKNFSEPKADALSIPNGRPVVKLTVPVHLLRGGIGGLIGILAKFQQIFGGWLGWDTHVPSKREIMAIINCVCLKGYNGP